MKSNQAISNQSSSSKPRVLVLGLDGGTFDIIKPMVAQGKLPHLARLMKQGSYAVLQSTYPPITPTAWTSFAIGKNPGQHGLYDFLKVNPGSYKFEPIPARQHGHKTVWQIISEAGGKVVVLDVPFTYPPEQVEGAILTGYGTPLKGVEFTQPPALRQELIDQCGSCELGFPIGLKYDVTPEFFREWDKVLDSRSCITTYLADKINWDFYMIVYGITDNLSHALWPYIEPNHPAYYEENAPERRQKLSDYYARIDREMGLLLDRCDDQTTVLVMSDHGFGSTPTPKYLTKLLLDTGLLKYKTNPISDKLMPLALNAYYKTPWLSRLVRQLSGKQRMGLKKMLTVTSIFPTPENVDWSRTRAFPGGYGMQVYINLKGKYPQGIVSPGAEYEMLLKVITADLLAMRDAVTHQPVIKEVHQGREVFSGSEFESAPDLIIEYNNVYTADKPADKSKINNSLEGNHVMEGIFIAQGANVVAQDELPPQQITDLAPTILQLLGLPIPPDMDGRVMESIFEPTYLTRQPIEYGTTPATTTANTQAYTAEEAEQVKQQLRALGYIE